MNKKFTKLMAALALLTFMTPSLAGWGQHSRTETTTTYTWTSRNWEDSSNSWENDKGGYQYNGTGTTNVQVTSNTIYTGAGATSKNEFTNITSITVNAATTTSGVGNITVKVGSGSVQTICSLSKNRTFTDYTLNFATPVSGKVTFAVNCSTNSMYMHSISVTTSDSGGSNTYTVTYNANGATSGTVPSDNTQYANGAQVTVLGNTGNLAKDHYTFGGWNTAADGGGTAYTAGQTFNITANTTLYAQWIADTYGYTLNITGEESHAETALYVDGVELQANDEIAYEAEVTVSVITDDFYAYSISVKDASNNTVTFNTTTESFIMPASAVTITVNITEIPTWTVSFTTNGIADGTKQVIQGDAIGTLPEATAEYIPAGYTFVGWYNGDITEPIQTAPTFISPADPVNSSLTLKAVFAQVSGTVSTGTLTEQEIKTNFTNNAQAYSDNEVEYEDNSDNITWAAKGNWSAGRPWIQIRNNTTPSYIKIEAVESISSVMVTITS